MAKEAAYLYVWTSDHLVRLNITELLYEEMKESSNSVINKAELVHDFLDASFPNGMGYMVVDSKVYLVGGERVKPAEGSSNFLEGEWIRPQYEECLNFEVFSFYPKATPSIRSCEDSFPKLNGPKTYPFVATIQGKIYDLCRKPYFGELSELKLCLQVQLDNWDDLKECIKDDSSCLRPILLRRPVMPLNKDPEVHNLHHKMENGRQCVCILCSTRMLVPSLLE